MKLTNEDIQALQEAIDERFEIAYDPFVDGIGLEMWGIHQCWDFTIPLALKAARKRLKEEDEQREKNKKV